jgi:hypothetical protein
MEEHPAQVPPVPVIVESPVKAQAMPGIAPWAPGTLTVDATNPQQIVGADPRRKRLVITAQTAAAFLSDSSAGALSNRRFRMPTDNPREFTHTGEVWALADTGSSVVSWYQEFWTE